MTREEYIRRKKIERRKQRRRRRRIKKMIALGILFLMLLFAILSVVGVVKLIKFLFFKEDKPVEPEKPVVMEEEKNIGTTILTAGDVILHDAFLKSETYLSEDGGYNYDSIFKYVDSEYEEADFSVVNFETTVADEEYSGYPKFRAPEEIVVSLSKSSVDMCLLANNHIYDAGTEGLFRTMEAMENNNLLYTGVQKDAEAKSYFVQEIDGVKVGMFNYVFDSGSQGGQEISINSNPVSDEDAKRINTFNYGGLEQYLYSEIEEGLEQMKEEGVEYTIAYIHWGKEYETTENERQQKIAKKLCELGIDALIGGHPHVVQPVDLLENEAGDHQMLCVYSLGNHLSDQRKDRIDLSPEGHTEDGLMVELVLEKSESGEVSLSDVEFIPTWVYREGGDSDAKFYILPLNDFDNLLGKLADLENVEADARASLERTNEIIGEGVEKVKAALPIIAK